MAKDRKTRGSSRDRSTERVDPDSTQTKPPQPMSTQGMDTVLPADLKQCPVCGQIMRAHSIQRGAHNTILTCPVPHPGAWDRDAFEPVNEFGMVLRTREPSGSDGEGARPE